ncbi:MAG: hypothetical protein KKA73_18890 [Chloroflexi bacterium]|nr:hypothetical protein [Chloroflexota bacterium]MBU1749756.1 hypothetical protein [Chloroflexota bacterium]MBU1879982.1 hypothetical protein [Chloroflexota bacterium]
MNHATRVTVATLGVIFGISGMSHGFFETLQGNTPTNGMFISAIGDAHRMWVHGNEYALTLIPNFLITGILAMAVGLAIVIWSVGFVHKKHGPLVFLLLFILLFLVGGGVAQIVFFILICAVATRINSPLTWWRKILPAGIRRVLARLWPWSLIIGSLLMLGTLATAVFGFVPGLNDPDQVLTVMLLSLVAGFSTILFTFVAGFAYDIERQANKEM